MNLSDRVLKFKKATLKLWAHTINTHSTHTHTHTVKNIYNHYNNFCFYVLYDSRHTCDALNTGHAFLYTCIHIRSHIGVRYKYGIYSLCPYIITIYSSPKKQKTEKQVKSNWHAPYIMFRVWVFWGGGGAFKWSWCMNREKERK